MYKTILCLHRFFLPDATIIPARFAICQSLDHFATLQTRPPTSNQGKQMRRSASCKRTVHLVQLFCLCFDKEQPEKQKILFNWQSVATGPVIEMTLRSLKTYFPVKLLLKEAVVTRIATISNHNKPLRLPLNILTTLIVSHSPTWCYVTSLPIEVNSCFATICSNIPWENRPAGSLDSYFYELDRGTWGDMPGNKSKIKWGPTTHNPHTSSDHSGCL